MSYPKVIGKKGESSGLFKIETEAGFGYFGNVTEKYITANDCIVWTQNATPGGFAWDNPNTGEFSCGPSSVAIIASTLSGLYVSVDEVLCTPNGRKMLSRATGPEDLKSIFDYCSDFNCEAKQEKINQTKLDQCLSDGGMAAFVSYCKGPYYSSNGSGHWVVICSKESNGTYKLVDSAHSGSVLDRFNKTFTFSQLQGESKAQCIYVTYSGTKKNNDDNLGSYNYSFFSNEATEAQKNLIKEQVKQQIEELEQQGIHAEVQDTGLVVDYSDKLKDYVKYGNVHKIKGLQTNPNGMIKTNFKQDYVVIVRKKLYFAATMTSEENYLRMYQINNFFNINTEISVDGQGTCTVTMKGGERVTCVNKLDEEDKNWEDWEHILNGFTNIDNEGESDGKKWRIGTNEWNEVGSEGIDYRNIMKAKEAKYGWRYAEKCDWEPMDELIVFSKSRHEKNDNGQYKFKKIFFGYIDSVKNNYTPQQGSTISIKASDQLKLLKYSYVNMSPTYFPGRFNNGKIDIRFDTDEFGSFKMNEPFVMALYNNEDEETIKNMTKYYAVEEVFSGIFPDIIIKNCCSAAGIPARYLNTRIEPVKVIPYIFSLKTNGIGSYSSAEFKSRLDYCREVAEICFMEFYQDEEGNIVFKIPNYIVGSNMLNPNNLDLEINQEIKNNIGVKINKSISIEDIKNLCKYVKPIIHKTNSNETLRSISKEYYNDEKHAIDIKYLNLGNLQSYNMNSKLKEMNILILSYDINSKQAQTEYQDLLNNSTVSAFTTKLYDIDSGREEELELSRLTMSLQTDLYIPVIPENEIIEFSLNDSDENLYNSVDINGQTYMNIGTEVDETKIKRTIPELDSIMRFGVRTMSSINTPFVFTDKDAEYFGHLMLLKSAALRYTADLTIIETPDVKVGEPIRLFTYDEHPGRESGIYKEEAVPSQSIYYVNSISRNIKVNGVSTMQLSLVAGRMIGQESIYDIMYSLYSQFYTLPPDIDKIKAEQIFQSKYNGATSTSAGGTSGEKDYGASSKTEQSEKESLVMGGKSLNRISDSEETCKSLVKTIKVKARNENGEQYQKELKVNRYLAYDIEKIFEEIYNDTQFIIKNNATYCYSYRKTNNGSEANNLSYHSYGAAIDINYNDNPFIGVTGSADDYSDDNIHIRTKNHEVVKIFEKYGWGWGGSYKDTTHFSYFNGY